MVTRTSIRAFTWFTLISLGFSGCASHEPAAGRSVLFTPDSPALRRTAPNLFRVVLKTSKGRVVLEIHRAWAPLGADRFYNLVRAGFYDDARFFRVIDGKWAQFGIPANPQIAQLWRTQTIPDDPPRESNVRGTIAFAFALRDGRTTQVFINLRDNSATHDGLGFVPFGRVIEGMDVVDALNSEYGESSGGGIRAGKQEQVFQGGNKYLNRYFPRLDYIEQAEVVGAAF